MMPGRSKQTLAIQILNCGGLVDLMSESEGMFLMNSLGLFRNVAEMNRATPRASATLARAYKHDDFYSSFGSGADVLHLIAHASPTVLQTGTQSRVTAADVERRGRTGRLKMPEIVVSTACEFQSPQWQAALAACGVQLLIAADSAVTPANLVAFDMAFYSALLSQVRRGATNVERAQASFEVADAHYRAVHAAGTPFARFSSRRL